MALGIVFIGLVLGLCVGSGLGYWIYRHKYNGEVKRAQAEGVEWVDQAQDAYDLLVLEQKDRLLEIEETLWGKADVELKKLEEKNETVEAEIAERKNQLDQFVKDKKAHSQSLDQAMQKREQISQKERQRLDVIKSKLQEMESSYKTGLSERSQTPIESALENLIQEQIKENRTRALQQAHRFEEESKENVHDLARRYLDIALDRFHRPYCPERGLHPVEIPNDNVKKTLMDPQHEVVQALQKACGCDIIVEAEMTSVGIAGFDPVRRELTRRTLEKLFKERSVDSNTVYRVAERMKKELFTQIKKDGEAIARELKQDDLHPEIKQMMGSLRYRYSFTQNQHFHCGEVGWLCGLLASELGGTEVSKARRSGLLHDLGKSMDHATEGGHAVIGADFIAQRKEAADVVHAVRAHHFDEQPATDMAFLVIAADAVSGARPGARRSTIETYTQKVTELATIARSFHGVEDCYILSGGREVRVIANSRIIDDAKALKLSAEIAGRIEAECNYPGQIKVVVVRQTFTHEMTRVH